MNIVEYLSTVELIDCQGRTTHRLTLLLDGRVRVRTGAVEATVDPTTRTTDPPTRRLGRGEYGHDQVIDVACTMTVDGPAGTPNGLGRR